MKELLDLVYTAKSEWGTAARPAFNAALKDRYPRIGDLTDPRGSDERRFQLRVNADQNPGKVPYAALIPPDQELSGPYGGMSFVLFPSDEPGQPALIAMGIGTNGLAPDETVLGRPGHARKCASIADWIRSRQPGQLAWAKHDPVRIDQKLPRQVAEALAPWKSTCDRYGPVLYALFAPPAQRTTATDEVVLDAITAFVDLFFDERGIATKAPSANDAERIRRAWLSRALPTTDDALVTALLKSRRFVVVEGPPGTGKTELARRLLKDTYDGNGRVIQFHPGTTYESFIGGLAPQEGGSMGFTFRAAAGHLMEAASAAKADPEKRYLLVIDEINRADLAKVLGEAIYLFEPNQPDRTVSLQYEFDGIGRSLALPANLDVIGTMNSADRSIAILDIAVRRRFAFVPLWPQLAVVEQHAGTRLSNAFHRLLTIFLEHASDDALALMPGHSYFLGSDEEADDRLATGVRPLLEEYIAQGYVAGFTDEIRAYLDGIRRGE